MLNEKMMHYSHPLCHLILCTLGASLFTHTIVANTWNDLDSNKKTEGLFRQGVKNFAEALQKPLYDTRESQEEWPLEKITQRSQEFLSGKLKNIPFINMTHQYGPLGGELANFLQIAVNEELKAKLANDMARAQAIRNVIKFTLENDKTGKNLGGKLRLGPNREDQPISLLHFALKNGLEETSLLLLEKWKLPIANASEEGLSVYPYIFDGSITDKDLLKKLRAKGAISLDGDFTTYLAKNPEKTARFVTWIRSLPEHEKILAGVKSRVDSLKVNFEKTPTPPSLLNLTRALKNLTNR